MLVKDKTSYIISKSKYFSRDLSWLKFNFRVLDQIRKQDRNIFEKLNFLAIAASNLDEFFMIRVGSLYNYIDYGKERIDYSGLRELPFRRELLREIQFFDKEKNDYFQKLQHSEFENNEFKILRYKQLNTPDKEFADHYFKKMVFPMLTPMLYDSYHTFPVLMNQILIFGIVTKSRMENKERNKLSFVQIPKNLPRFLEIEKDEYLIFVPIEEIIREHIQTLFRNVEIQSVNLFRITRNGDFTLEESEDIESNFLEEVKRKIKKRKTGRVVRVEIDQQMDPWILKTLKNRWKIDQSNLFFIDKDHLIDYTGLWQIIRHDHFKDKLTKSPSSVAPLEYPEEGTGKIFETLKRKDILLHHPYNNFNTLFELIETAAEDPNVLSIKMTIYRIAKNSRITSALLKAAENGKHVSVLFELKARFDEENNIKAAQKLRKAGCFVIYGMSNLKTHTKLLLIVRKEQDKVTRYVHMSSGNYNEYTAKIYTDIGIMTSNENYANDVSEFFNVITGHSLPHRYQYLIAAPRDMRNQLLKLINAEIEAVKAGLDAMIIIKINSLQDTEIIDALYQASQAGVKIKLIVRGICCLRPGRKGLSEHISVYSIVGNFLEHSRIFYFHNQGDPKIYGGSADIMVRSFDRRIESSFQIISEALKKQVKSILYYTLKDNVNSYLLNEDGTYTSNEPHGKEVINSHAYFFKMTKEDVDKTEKLLVQLF